jgi:hypothetical protein
MTIQAIYQGAQALINQIIRKESTAQGHYLTGALEDSLASLVKKEGGADVMQGTAVYYAQFVNEGLPASSASFKQVPFLIEYFEKRGYPFYSTSGVDARTLAFATIAKWKKEGMPTQASKRFSKTGSRVQMIENAITGSEGRIDEFMGDSFDFGVEEQFQKEKSETI